MGEDRRGGLLASQLMNLDRVSCVGRQRGTLTVSANIRGGVDDIPAHLFRLAERFGLAVLHRQTWKRPRGLGTVVELCEADRAEAVWESLRGSDRDAPVLQEPDLKQPPCYGPPGSGAINIVEEDGQATLVAGSDGGRR